MFCAAGVSVPSNKVAGSSHIAIGKDPNGYIPRVRGGPPISLERSLTKTKQNKTTERCRSKVVYYATRVRNQLAFLGFL